MVFTINFHIIVFRVYIFITLVKIIPRNRLPNLVCPSLVIILYGDNNNSEAIGIEENPALLRHFCISIAFYPQ